MIHQAYHLAQFEAKTGTQLKDVDLIVEFGGGYGSMCRLFHNLGFRGRYVIFDLPQFSALQEFFLESIGMKLNPIDTLGPSQTGVTCISDIPPLKDLLNRGIEGHNSMLLRRGR